MDNENMNNQSYWAGNQQVYGQGQYGAGGQQVYGQGQYGADNQQVYGQGQYGTYDQQAYGYAQSQYDGNAQMGYGQPPKKSNKKLIMTIAIIVAVLVAVVVAAVIVIVMLVTKNKTGAETAKELANKLVDCIENEDIDGHYSLYDEEYLDFVKDEFDYTDKEVEETLEDNLLEEIDYIEDYTGKIEKITVTDISVDSEKFDADDREHVKDEFGITASEGADIEIELEVEGKDDDDDSMVIYCAAYKKGDRWYLLYWYIW